MILGLPEWAITILTILVWIIGTARLTRVLVYDDFPPSIWIRDKWSALTRDGQWSKLVKCWWCASFWIALISLGWYIAGTHVLWISWAWWVFWGALAGSYLATMLIVRDTPSDKQ